ncbi:VOC family protein [Streptomyces tsukubensis]|uniref:Glyoxalase n=1 Tax=Streptomyces tsukubensis TaxID=83656 RepID=A0A1V4A2T6_9ACTN|nr:VOC family protein [Streptomyces tsukubensis]OON72988.1 glyoxalase [Streptomyces tsukubensis]QFR93971.1 VOC family protein [Streptomyces tsukubensis]
MAIAKMGAIVLDCEDPRALAEFYAALLGGTPETGGPDWINLKDAPGAPLAFQAAPGFVPPQWPSAEHSQQFHLDVRVDDLAEAEQEVLALGAKVLDKNAKTFWVYADPAGHPFCLCLD